MSTEVMPVPVIREITVKVSKQPGLVKRTIYRAKQNWDRKDLVMALGTLLRAAKDHDENGLPSGSTEYALLYSKAKTLLAAYAGKYQLPVAALEAEMPALAQLERRTRVLPRLEKRVGAQFFGAMLLFFMLPVLWALCNGIYASVLHVLLKHLT